MASQIQDAYRLAPVQQGMLFHVVQAPADSGVYLAQGLFEFIGRLDSGVLKRAWEVVAARHPVLRTGFVWEGVPAPVQVVHEEVSVPLQVLDWSGAADGEQEQRLEALREADRAREFDLAAPPLWRVYVMNRGGERFWMVWSFHHLCLDGWSAQVILGELQAAYRQLLAGTQPVLPPVRPYRDFIAWLAGRDAETAREFWQGYLAGFTAPTPLPADRPPLAGGVGEWAQERRRVVLSPEVTRGLEGLARSARVTLSTVVQAAWALLLSRYSGEDDVVFGLTVSGRPPELPGMESMVGVFINTLPVRARVSGGQPFDQWLRELQDEQVAMRRFEHTGLADVQRYSPVPAGTGLFDSVLVVGNYPRLAAVPAPTGNGDHASSHELVADGVLDGGLQDGAAGAGTGAFRGLESVELANYPLMVVVGLDAELWVEAEFSLGVFDGGTVERLLGQLGGVLEQVAGDGSVPAGRVRLGSAADEGLALGWGRGLGLGPAAGDGVLVSAGERVRRLGVSCPDVVAVSCGEVRLSYGELSRRAGRLAAALVSAGAGREVAVGVVLERSADLAVALTGVLWSGGVYVPLPPDLPARRLGVMAAAAGVRVVVTDAAGVAAAEGIPGFGGRVVRLDRLDEVARPGPEGRVVPVVSAGDGLAYVAFTSGSTGLPKGVGVSQGALAGYVAGWEPVLGGVRGDGPVLSMAGAGFDVSVGDLVRGLCSGRGVALLPGGLVSAEGLFGVLAGAGVGVAEVVPGVLLRELAAYCAGAAGGAGSLGLVISGTDVWRADELAGLVRVVGPGAVAANVYGVTEAAVDSLLMPAVAPGPGLVPVGRPLAGVRALVLDGWMRPVAAGVPGELFIGGRGVARGYLGRAGLTAERFVADPFTRGARLYRTGDRARWRADGQVEFLGRVDEQLKVRGFRIEPGEVEAVLCEHPAVTAAVVTARDDGPGGKRLVGYLVGAPGGTVDTGAIREFAAARLPGYMVPAVLVMLDSVPLTANGKVDRRALPAPPSAREAGTAYVPPRTAAEVTLAGIWAQVLGVDRVGLQDNFFELGGDSILSLQIVARARAAGLRLEIADIFTRQTIGALAPVAAPVAGGPAADAGQGPVSGPVLLTPAQHWFLDQPVSDRDHWNWSGVFELAPGTDPAALARAVRTVVAHHDALRTRLAWDPAAAAWNQAVAAAEDHEVFARADAAGLDGPALEDLVTARMTAAQESLDLAAGPLLRIVQFTRGPGKRDWLGITVHHLVMDGVSWQVLLTDLERACHAQPLPPKTTSFQAWAARLHELAGDPGTWAELPYWAGQSASGFTLPADLPVDPAAPAGTEDSASSVRAELDADTAGLLLGRAHRAYRTRAADLLLAGLVRAVGDWAGARAVRVDLESHGRADIGAEVDVSRTVGWFTSIYPVTLSAPDPGDPRSLLMSVKEQLRAVPRYGTGYGMLRYLTPVPGDDDRARQLAALRAQPAPPVLFNYMGSLMRDGDGTSAGPDGDGGLLAGALSTGLAGPVAAPGKGQARPHALQVEAWREADGRLVFEWHYSTSLHYEETIQRVADAHVRALEAIVGHCLSPQAGGLTPSDLPLAGLDQAGVDRLAQAAPGLADAYPLAPVQQGMVFHAVQAPAGAGMYWGQGLYEFDGRLDPEMLGRAWEVVAARHPALRTGFVWEGVDEPLQVVRDRVSVPFETLDWSDAGDGEQERRLDGLRDADRARGFDLAAAPLWRVQLIDRGGERYWMVLGLFQGLLDGWSLPVILGELQAAYRQLQIGTQPVLPPVRPYRDFIAWLAGRDAETAREFWQGYLAGFTAPTPLPADRPPLAGGVGEWAQERRRVVLSPEVTRGLEGLARRARVTLSTVVQAAWALLLSRYSGEDDIVFGLTVSGRPPELAGMETMVGLFINTLPVRARVPGDQPFDQWLRELQDDQIAMRRFEHTGLADVQRYSPVPAGTGLFDSIIVVGNYPGQPVPDGGLRDDIASEDTGAFRGLESVELANYPLMVVVGLDAELWVEAEFSLGVFDGGTVERLLGQLGGVLEQVAGDGSVPAGRVRLGSAADEGLALGWGRGLGLGPGAGDGVLVSAGERVRRLGVSCPDVVAVSCGEVRLSYGELSRRAGRLAAALVSAGAGREVAVGVVLERSADLAVALTGVLWSGGVYVPLPPDLPARRLGVMAAAAGVRVVVTDAAGVAAAEGIPGFGGRVVRLDRLDEVARPGPEGRVVPVVSAGDGLAYVAFTSGSTGLPKGVGVSQGALAGYVAGWEPVLGGVRGDGPVLSMAGAGFDVSVGDLVRGLCSGRGVALLPGGLVSAEGLFGVLAGAGVGVAEVVPGVLLRELAAYCAGAAGGAGSLGLVISGTDVWRADELAGLVRVVGPGAVAANVYGVTEAAVDSLLMPAVAPGPGLVPVGRPLAGVRALVLDGWMRPVAAGVPGELFIGGRGVARGYLGRAGLTAERFVADPFTRGARLYRTGDRARWRADGQVEFLGRVDEQLKVRGFRIEPGEVEAVLCEHPAVTAAVVTARDDGPGGKRLVGYLVGAPGGTVDTGAIREFAAARLPGYMVPAVLVMLDSVPLTANGKVDRRALPAPPSAREAGTAYVPPRTAAEVTLAGIWAQVLGVDRVGLQDNFFELGGDSILSLQIVARARAAGLRLEIADIFTRQTIGALAPLLVAAAPAGTRGKREQETGPVPLTPAQHWFLEQDIAGRDHWNWSGMFELAPGTSPEVVDRALRAVTARHPMLRARLAYDRETGTWNQTVPAAEGHPVLDQVDAASLDGPVLEEMVTARMTAAQESLDLAAGPLLRIVQFTRGPGKRDWLGITVHHLVMDGVSWNILLSDLESASHGTALEPAASSYRAWAARLHELAGDPGTWAELPYWAGQSASGFTLPADLPVDPAAPAGTEDSASSVRAELDADTAGLLLGRAHRAYRTRAADLLLAGLVRAVGDWAGARAVRVDLESHGRADIGAEVDVSRTVGWFTSIYPVTLSAPDPGDPRSLLMSVKEQLRAVPRYGTGYGMLRYLTPVPGDDDRARQLAALRAQPAPPVLFNYMGTLETSTAGPDGDGGLLARPLPGELAGPVAAPGKGQARPHALQVEAWREADGRLVFEWHYSTSLHYEETIQRVADAHVRALEAIVGHCLSPQAGGLTPSDLPLAGLDQAGVDRLAQAAPGLADAYPLAPVQQGMVFHAVQAPAGAGMYWGQGLYEFDGRLDPEMLGRAWEVVAARHPALRTGFVWEGVDEPLQVVRDRVSVPFETLDWSDAGDGEQRERLDALRDADRAEGFDLAAAPLWRVQLIDRGGERYWMVLGLFQGLLDGWSLPVIIGDLQNAYRQLQAGTQPVLPPVRPYRDFIQWLAGRDTATARDFWQGYLAGFTAPTPLPADRVRVAGEYDQDRLRIVLSREVTQALQDLARSARVTLSTVVQAAWALLLSRYSGEDDIVFGLTVSGRPPELAGMETMVGLFMNTLPVRTRVQADRPFAEWLRDLQDDQINVRRFEHTVLADIQRYSPVPAGTSLFDSIIVVGNYPGQPAPDGGPRDAASGDAAGAFRGLESVEQTNYPLMLVVDGVELLEIELQYISAMFDGGTAGAVLEHLGVVLGAVAGVPGVLVGGVEVLAAGERELVVGRWNETGVVFPAVTLAGLFGVRAVAGPDAVAVVSGDERLSYAELDAASSRLARLLVGLGAGPERVVAVALPRGCLMVVALLAVVKAGAAYLPVDGGYPAGRVGFMLADAGAMLVVTDAATAAGPPDAGVPLAAAEAGVPLVVADDPATVAALDALPGTAVTDADRVAPLRPGNPAYVIYTSGSTGVPKGVMIPHSAIVNCVLWMAEQYGAGPGDRMLFKTPFTFDVSVTEFFLPLATGATLVVARPDGQRDPGYLAGLIETRQVTVAQFVPSMLDAFLTAGGVGPGYRSVRQTICAGETLPGRVRDRFAELGGPSLQNLYGPTEATVYQTFWDCAQDAPGEVVRIGRPLANTRVFVMDERLRPLPAGVPGELFVGGQCLARGYASRPDLTAERFVADPFAPGQRLYRTGDRARWRAGGGLEFLGRVDEQVKVRGFRIEPGEVEAVLCQYPGVTAAVVAARDDGPGGRRLVGYVVPGQADGAGPDLDTGALREFAAARLPGYMVPSVLVAIPEVPLTANGKADRRALPAPPSAREAGTAYVPPRTAAEIVLAGIWEQLLGVDRVGLEDNFFELGGDSILSLQIVARARAAGLRVEIADVFARQNVGALAAAAVPAVPAADREDEETGPVPLTPVQHWFLDQPISGRDHWNWSGVFELTPGATPDALDRALRAVVSAHPMLRARLAWDPGTGTWSQSVAAADNHSLLELADAAGLDGPALEEMVTARMTVAQESLDLAAGPLLRAVLFTRGPGEPDWLGITVHHLVMDGVSWNILLSDLETASHGTAFEPAASSYRAWARRLHALAGDPGTWAELPYWTSQLEQQPHPLPADLPGLPGATGTEDSASSVRAELDADTAGLLLGRAHRAYRTRAADLLLAGLVRAVGQWAGARAVTVDLESHGRADVGADVDVSRTVGWFTSIYPVTLSAPDREDPRALLMSVKEQLRAVPRHGIGYGMLRHLAPVSGSDGHGAGPDTGGLARLRQLPSPPILFNYMGTLETIAPHTPEGGEGLDAAGTGARGGLLAGVLPGELAGPRNHAGPGQARTHALQVEAWREADGRLVFEWHYSTSLHYEETIQRVADAHVRALEAIVGHCLSPEAGGLTPSDLPLAGLDQAGVDRLAQAAPGLADAYPLTPVQQGMLFHVLQARAVAGVYWGQGLFEFTGRLDTEALGRAWETVAARHPALRTGFAWEGVDQPLQVVHDQVSVPLRMLDWSDAGDGEQERRLESLRDADRAEGFDLAAPPLWRVYVVDRGGDRFWMLWSFHHLCLDGWSAQVVVDELQAAYRQLLRRARPALSAARPYRDFIQWLAGRDAETARDFWQEYLAGFTAPTPLPADRPGRADAAEQWAQDRLRLVLSPEVTRGLEGLARRARVTLSTVVQAAWALLLSRYSGEDDVVFGLTVSGRPPELPGMESMVGVFINTLPVRARVSGDQPFDQWLRELQDEQVAMRRFEHTPLADIQRYSPVPAGTGLFDSIIVVGNYPGQPAPDGGLPDGTDSGDFRGLEMVEQTNYPLTLLVDVVESLEIDLEYVTAMFDGGTAGAVLEHLGVVLGAVAGVPGVLVGGVEVLAAGERELVVGRWNETGVVFPAVTLAGLFGVRAVAGPDAVAVVSGDERLSYAELDAASSRLARLLVGLGAGPERVVAVALPRGCLMVVALLAVVKAGAAYLPVDGGYPAGRVGFMLADAGAMLVVTDAATAAGLPDAGVPLVIADDPATAAVVDALPGTAVTDADRVAPLRPGNPAYVIYTSGSTGVPKGVMVPHAGIVNCVLWMAQQYAVGAGDRMLLKTPFTFDVSVAELFLPLATGATLVVARPDGQRDPGYLAGLIETRQVTVAQFVPSMLDAFLTAGGVGPGYRSVRQTICAGEALPGRVRDRFAELGGSGLHNVYGPTEASVYSTFWDCAQDVPGEVVRIGRPVANTRAWVLDERLRPVPDGMPGALYVAGAGLARGYLGRPGLTAERFVADPFGSGQRLYRTGDRARRRPGGGLEYLGRADEQVKVRGFRIEPGEIEAALCEHPAVVAAVVAARDDGPGGLRLVGYVVPVPGGTVDTGALREHAAARLPGYMVPAVLVTLDSIPLTASGKADRRALPAPPSDRDAGTAYVPPRTAAEVTLAGIWAQVLGVDRVGLEDNFFELGGDSILSLQIVARARAAGLRLEIADVFARQNVGALAAAAAPAALAAEREDEETGPVPLTPAQLRFLNRGIAGRGHWNWSGVFELAPDASPDAVERAVRAVVAVHPMLRARLAWDPAAGTWSQSVAPAGDGGPDGRLDQVDAAALDGPALENLVTAEMTAAQESLDLAAGPLLRAVLFTRGPGERDWLGITVHHLVLDGVSWTILLGDLEAASHGAPVAPATASYRAWARRLHELAGDPGTWAELPYWTSQLEQQPHPLPADLPGPADEASARMVTADLGAKPTAALRAEAHDAYRTRTSDLVLAALLQALARWTGDDTIAVDLETDGRHVAGGADTDLSRTVGRFSLTYPVTLSSPDLDDPARLLSSVKEQLRAVPGEGIGYGLLRHADPPPAPAGDEGDDDRGQRLHRFRSLPGPRVLFVDGQSRDVPPAGWAGPAGGGGGQQPGSHLLRIEAVQANDGGLAFEWRYRAGVFRPETVRRLAADHVQALRELIEHCLRPGAGGFTPSDFPLAGLDQSTLDALIQGGGQLTDD